MSETMPLYSDAHLELIFIKKSHYFRMEQRYSDAYFPRRQIHVTRKDVRFKLKGRRNNNKNYSLSHSHARIVFENFLTILTAITI